MSRSISPRRTGVGALLLGLIPSSAFAQESLPTIDIGSVPPPAPRSSISPAEAARSYVVRGASTATKTDTPILETPASVQVVPQAVISDQKVTRIEEALENVSGVRPNQSIGSGTDFLIRGFGNNRKIFRNGLLATSPSSYRNEFDSGNIERIEVLKGPAALLFGRMEPGGLVNVVTKRPSDAPYHSIEQRFGSYDHFRTVWDSTGPIDQNNALLYRFSGAYENSGSFRDFQHIDRILLNPSVTARLTPDTELTVDFEYFTQDYLADFGLPSLGDRPAPLPISRSFGDPNDPRDNMHKFYVASELTHRFDENWTFRNRFLASYLHTNDQFLNPAPVFPPLGALTIQPGGVVRRNIFGQASDSEVYSTNFDLSGKFDLMGTHHDTLVGFDYLNASTAANTWGNFNTPNPAFDINVYFPWPSYGIPRALFDAAVYDRKSIARDHSVFQEEQKGVYFQDHITLWDKLHIIGGGRYDWSEVGRGRGPTFEAAQANLVYAVPTVLRWDEAFSPRVGVLYQAVPWASVYGSWTNSFGSNNGVDANNRPLPPQKGEQFEIGVKTELFNSRLTTTLAFYDLTKTNLPTPDLSTPDPNDSIPIGKQRSKGLELDTVGKISDSLSAIGAFTFMDARVIKDNNFNAQGIPLYQGRRLPNVPRYSGSLWLKWDVEEFVELDGVSFGFGAYVVGNRQGDRTSSFQLPGYVRFDALAAYRWNVGSTKVTAQLNIRNLTNTKYYESTDPESNVDPRYGIYPGAPFSAIGSIKFDF
ncbi:TonB-dependent siderophore receptor [Methylosinus sporium]|uniref:TonB-dependent siderophore receptor n=1 Tax=Methylosinus sporium TaxID=428 RepID=UPI00383ABC52